MLDSSHKRITDNLSKKPERNNSIKTLEETLVLIEEAGKELDAFKLGTSTDTARKHRLAAAKLECAYPPYDPPKPLMEKGERRPVSQRMVRFSEPTMPDDKVFFVDVENVVLENNETQPVQVVSAHDADRGNNLYIRAPNCGSMKWTILYNTEGQNFSDPSCNYNIPVCESKINNTGLIVGGVIAGVAALAAGIGFWCRRRRAEKERAHQPSIITITPPPDSQQNYQTLTSS